MSETQIQPAVNDCVEELFKSWTRTSGKDKLQKCMDDLVEDKLDKCRVEGERILEHMASSWLDSFSERLRLLCRTRFLPSVEKVAEFSERLQRMPSPEQVVEFGERLERVETLLATNTSQLKLLRHAIRDAETASKKEVDAVADAVRFLESQRRETLTALQCEDQAIDEHSSQISSSLNVGPSCTRVLDFSDPQEVGEQIRSNQEEVEGHSTDIELLWREINAMQLMCNTSHTMMKEVLERTMRSNEQAFLAEGDYENPILKSPRISDRRQDPKRSNSEVVHTPQRIPSLSLTQRPNTIGTSPSVELRSPSPTQRFRTPRSSFRNSEPPSESASLTSARSSQPVVVSTGTMAHGGSMTARCSGRSGSIERTDRAHGLTLTGPQPSPRQSSRASLPLKTQLPQSSRQLPLPSKMRMTSSAQVLSPLLSSTPQPVSMTPVPASAQPMSARGSLRVWAPPASPMTQTRVIIKQLP